LVELVELLAGSSKADLETVSFAEPSIGSGFGYAGNQVVTNLDKPPTLGYVRAQQRAADAGVFVDARRGIGTTACAECDLAPFEGGRGIPPTPVRWARGIRRWGANLAGGR
jgi:hypothetical protein